ncbi:MAG: LptF/LptG family permease [Bacteroidales bacterium]|nr:LptF/LptG family permease [Bacteroidales bacterium]
MQKLDKYILAKYIKTFLLALALIIVIIITFDVSEKLDRLISHHATFWQVVFDYYGNFIPGFVNLYSPLFIFISVLFFTSKMAGNTEVIAILGSGISYRRMLRPYLYGSSIVALVVLMLGNFVLPISNRHLMEFEDKYIKSHTTSYYNNIHFQSERGVQVYAGTYDAIRCDVLLFQRDVFDDKGCLKRRETANFISYDSVEHSWICHDYVVRTIEPGGNEDFTYENGVHKDLGLVPEDFDLLSKDITTMNTPALVKHIQRERFRGTGIVKEAQIELWQRLLNPIAIIVMTFIGVAIAARKSRGGIGLHLAMGIAIAFAFIVFMKITTVFATNGDLSPFMAVLLPQLIFGIAAGILIYKAPK